MVYKDKKIILLAHIFTTVPVQDLKEYFLKHKVERLLLIGHPLFYVKGRPGAFLELYENGKLVKKIQHRNIYLPNIIQYIKDVILTLYWVIKIGEKWDVIIALDNLNAISGLLLRLHGSIKKVVYYTIDFVPERFENKLLNDFYHFIEKIAVKHSNITWNLTERVTNGRATLLGMDPKRYNRQSIVPIGIWFDRYPRKKFNEIEKHTLIYAGGLAEHQGIQLVLDALPSVIKKIPDLQFKIIGIGNYEDALRQKVKKLKLDKYVSFLGYMESHKDVEKILSGCGLAVAMYSQELSKWSYYADPSKIKTYIAAGLPIITTNLTMIAQDLKKNRCGIVIPYDKNILAESISALLKDEKKQKAFRENAVSLARGYDWNTILDKEMKSIFN